MIAVGDTVRMLPYPDETGPVLWITEERTLDGPVSVYHVARASMGYVVRLTGSQVAPVAKAAA